MISEKNKRIIEAIKKSDLTQYDHLRDLLDMAILVFQEDDSELEYCLKITKYIKELIPILPQTQELNNLYWRAMLFEAPYKFESFMLYMEKNRPVDEKFYQPRINPLRQVAEAIQELADDKLDELFINMPSRVGKTQIVKFAFVWFGSRNSETSNLYTAFSDKITKAFYNGCIELVTDPTYTYAEIFPDNKVVKTNGEDETIELNRVKTYPTYTCRSIYGTLNGACDCNGLAIADDLLSGIEEAISIDRLDTVWGKFDNNFMQRLKKKAKLINMGTRWALMDPQGRRRSLLEAKEEYKNRRYKVISIPALNENDESNFNYPFDLGYDTEYYLQRRASFEDNDDMASWYAQAMQEPIERQGALFTSGNMKFYDGILPEETPDRIFMAVDEAFGGGDYVSGPICYQFGDEYYIPDVVFDNGDKKVTQPKIAEKILYHRVQAVQFEETKTTRDYREKVEELLRKKGFRTNSYGRPAPGNLGKRTRIFDKAPEIRDMYFLDNEHRTKEYQKFIQNLYSFKMEGKVKHDDGPDSMAQICDMKLGTTAKVQILSRASLGI